MPVQVESVAVTTVLHVSDLHFGRPASSERLQSLLELITELEPDAVAISGDLTQRCSKREFEQARRYLDGVGKVAPYIVIPAVYASSPSLAAATSEGPASGEVPVFTPVAGP